MLADFWAGYLSGAAGIIIGNPLDLVKVRLQASSSSTSASQLLPGSIQSAPRAASLYLPKVATIRSLLKGLPAPVLTYGALNALVFTTYNRSLHVFSPHPDHINNGSTTLQQDFRYPYWSHFVAGCVAGLATFIISTPTEVVKCRTQLTQDTPSPHIRGLSDTSTVPPTRTSSWSIARSIYRTKGLRGFYEGGVITSVRDAVGYGFYFLAYETSKDLWDSVASTGSGNTADMAVYSVGGGDAVKFLLCGGVAGVATWASIFPLDVIKTRVQTQMLVQPMVSGSAEATASTPLISQTQKPLGAWAIARHAYRTEGVHVFFRGMTVCCVRAFIVNAVQWAVYEWMIHYLAQ